LPIPVRAAGADDIADVPQSGGVEVAREAAWNSLPAEPRSHCKEEIPSDITAG